MVVVTTILGAFSLGSFSVFAKSISIGGAIELTKKIREIGQIIGIFDTIGKDIEQLKSTPFNMGMQNLEYAENAHSPAKSLHYLMEATQNFTAAKTLEKEERLVQAYLGLSFCFFLQGEFKIAIKTLKDFSLADIYVRGDKIEQKHIQLIIESFKKMMKKEIEYFNKSPLSLLFPSSKIIEKSNFLVEFSQVIFSNGFNKNVNYKSERYLKKVLNFCEKYDFGGTDLIIYQFSRQLRILEYQNQALKLVQDYEKCTKDRDKYGNIKKIFDDYCEQIKNL